MQLLVLEKQSRRKLKQPSNEQNVPPANFHALSSGDAGFQFTKPRNPTKTSLSLIFKEVMKSYSKLLCSKTPCALLKNNGGFGQEPILASIQITVRKSYLTPEGLLWTFICCDMFVNSYTDKQQVTFCM